MNSRSNLQTMLENLLGSRCVYFQPPDSVRMHYPAIVYSLNDISATHANNSVYNLTPSYQLIYIDDDPDSGMVRQIAALPRCRFVRSYAADNLNHYVYNLYY